MLQSHLVFSLPLPRNQSFLQGTQFLLLGSCRRVKDLGTKCAHHCGVSPGAPEGRAGGKYTHTRIYISEGRIRGENTLSHTHTLIFISVFISVSKDLSIYKKSCVYINTSNNTKLVLVSPVQCLHYLFIYFTSCTCDIWKLPG